MVFFADRMYQLRNEKGYTREQLASELGCMPRQIQDYEEGKLYPHAITMVDIADFFDVSLDYLMGRTECREINKSNKSNKMQRKRGEREWELSSCWTSRFPS